MKMIAFHAEMIFIYIKTGVKHHALKEHLGTTAVLYVKIAIKLAKLVSILKINAYLAMMEPS